MKRVIIAMLSLVMLASCGEASSSQNVSERQTTAVTQSSQQHTQAAESSTSSGGNVTEQTQQSKENSDMKLTIGGKTFEAELEDNDTAKAFKQMLPCELDMSELHGNEKYNYLDKDLVSDAQSVDRINAGDIMLYGSSCVVVFYKSFDTQYSYTRIGHIKDTSGLEEAVGDGSVVIRFE